MTSSRKPFYGVAFQAIPVPLATPEAELQSWLSEALKARQAEASKMPGVDASCAPELRHACRLSGLSTDFFAQGVLVTGQDSDGVEYASATAFQFFAQEFLETNPRDGLILVRRLLLHDEPSVVGDAVELSVVPPLGMERFSMILDKVFLPQDLRDAWKNVWSSPAVLPVVIDAGRALSSHHAWEAVLGPFRAQGLAERLGQSWSDPSSPRNKPRL